MTMSAVLPEYIDQRRVGDAVVSVIRDGSLLFPPRFAVPEPVWRQALPEADAEGRVRFDLNVTVVQLGAATIMIDPACDDPDSAWQEGFARHFQGVERSPGMAAALDALGIAPQQVTHVLITHNHSDHLGGVLVERDGAMAVRFPNARHLIGRADWVDNPRRADPDSELARLLTPVETLGLLELVDDEREVVPGVTMLPAPGETPGHCVVRVESSGERCYVVGDLIHHQAEVEHLDWAFPGRDVAAMQASRAHIFAEASTSAALIISGHERFPPWGRIVRDNDGYRWTRVS